VTTRNDIIKHFKKLAEHSAFLQYAAESAERIGWALEVNLRDNRGRVILQLGSEPGAHWVSNLPGECVTGVAGSTPAPSGGYITEAAGRIDQAIRDWNALDAFGGTGPARAARRARAEAVAAATSDAQAERGAHEAAFDACAAEVSPSERFNANEWRPGDAFRSANAQRACGKVMRAASNPSVARALRGGTVLPMASAAPSTDPVATASLSVEAMEPVRPDTSRQSVQPWAVRYIGLYCDTEDASRLVWAWECNEGKYVLGVWTESKNTFDFVRDPRTCPSWTLVKAP
jgi:hypothetical protein